MKVLILESIPQEYKEKLESVAGTAITYTNKNEVTQEQLQQSEVIIGNPTMEQLDTCDALQWLQLSSAGANTYAAHPRQFTLTNASGAYGVAISEYMLTCTLNALKHFPEYLHLQSEKVWENLGHVATISDCTVLVVGMGDIGSAYAKRMKLLGAKKVIGVRRTLKELPKYYDEQYTFDTMQEALTQSDIIALALPETPETIHVFNKERLSSCKKDAVLINVGRGSAIDTESLITLCKKDHFSSVYLDVFDHEPVPKNSVLWNTPHLYVTPHIAGRFNASTTVNTAMNIFVKNLQNYVNNEPLENIVDRTLGY